MMRRAWRNKARRGDSDENTLDSLSAQIFRKEGAASEVAAVVWSCRGVRLQEKQLTLWDNRALGPSCRGGRASVSGGGVCEGVKDRNI